jgi:hypothetical protein
MKFLAMFLLGTFFASAAPSEILFGQKLFTQALAEAGRGMVTGYGEGVEYASQWDFAYKPISSTKELGDIIKTQKVDYVLSDPRKRIMIDARVQNQAGEDLFIGSGSFLMVSRRDASGRKTYVAPQQDAIQIYFQLAHRDISFAGAESAMVQSVDGSTAWLEVNNGVITIPSFVGSNPDYWNTLWVSIQGKWVRYDGNGSLIRETIANITPNQPYFGGGLRTRLEDSTLSQSLSPEYGWSPVLEFDNSLKQVVTLDISSEWKARPTYIRIFTLDQKRQKVEIPSTVYDLEGDGWDVPQIQLELEKGTYFIEIEWPTWLDEFRSSNGGGKD